MQKIDVIAQRSRRLAVAVFVMAASAGTAAAQHRGQDHLIIRSIDKDRRFEVSLHGKVEFTPDERDITSLSPDGRFSIEESGRNLTDRQVIFTADGSGGVNRVYILNGRAHAWDAAAQSWLDQMLPKAAREFGIGAEQRVRRIHAQGGARGVLDEIAQISSASSRRRHFGALMDLGPIPQRDIPRALQIAGGMSGSSDRAWVLSALYRDVDLRNTDQRSAYFAAINDISSSSERQRLLVELIERDNLADVVLTGALDVVRNISSSSARGAVLVSMAERHPLTAEPVRNRYFAAVDGIPSSSERRRVLTSVLRRHGEQPAVVRAAIRSAQHITSDSEKAAVLMEVPLLQLRDSSTAQTYRETADTIRSSSSRQRVSRRLTGSEG